MSLRSVLVAPFLQLWGWNAGYWQGSGWCVCQAMLSHYTFLLRFLILSSGLQFLPQLVSVFSHDYFLHEKYALIFFLSKTMFYCYGCRDKYHSVVVKTIDIHFLKTLKSGISESGCPLRYFFPRFFYFVNYIFFRLYALFYLIPSLWIFSTSWNKASHIGLLSTQITAINFKSSNTLYHI